MSKSSDYVVRNLQSLVKKVSDETDDVRKHLGALSDLGWVTDNVIKAIKQAKEWVDQRAINPRTPPYNTPANNTDDDAAILNQVIADFFANTSQVNGVGGKTFIPPKIILPPGQYVLNTPIIYNPSVPSGSLGDYVSLVIEGVGFSTSIRAGTTTTMFDFVNGSVHISNIRMNGNQGKKGFILGRTSKDEKGNFRVISQSTFSRINMNYFETDFEIQHAFDTSWYDCGYFSHRGTSPIGFNVLPHTDDNTNNLQFFRNHWETIVNGTMFKIKGINGSSTIHNNFGFYGCHFENRSFNTTAFDIEYMNGIHFANTPFTRNNKPNGEAEFVTELHTVPLFKLRHVSRMSFDDCAIMHLGTNGTAALPNSLFELSGVISIAFKSSFILTGVNTANKGINALWQPRKYVDGNGNKVVDNPIFPNGVFAIFDGNTFIDDKATAPAFNNLKVIASAVQRNKKWVEVFNETTNILEEHYDTSSAGVVPNNLLYGKSTDGMFAPKSLGGIEQTVPNNGTVIFSISFNNNPNKRGIYEVMADYSGAAFGEFWSTGSAIIVKGTPGADCVIGTTNPNVAGKLNIYLNGNSIAVNNQLGSDRRVALFARGFRS